MKCCHEKKCRNPSKLILKHAKTQEKVNNSHAMHLLKMTPHSIYTFARTMTIPEISHMQKVPNSTE